jgi:hypothetical protein
MPKRESTVYDKPSPGPWVAERAATPALGWVVYAPDCSPHAKPGDRVVVADYLTPGNACLIKAARDLLEALQDLFGADMEHCMRGDGKDDQLEAIAKAHAAVAKATRSAS